MQSNDNLCKELIFLRESSDSSDENKSEIPWEHLSKEEKLHITKDIINDLYLPFEEAIIEKIDAMIKCEEYNAATRVKRVMQIIYDEYTRAFPLLENTKNEKDDITTRMVFVCKFIGDLLDMEAAEVFFKYYEDHYEKYRMKNIRKDDA